MPAETETETETHTQREREGEKAPILVARTKFCAINIHFQYDAPNECMSSEESTHRTHSMRMTHVFMVHQFVCCCVCRSEAFTVLFLWLHWPLPPLRLNISMLYDVCKSVWLELILLGLITSWQIRTPHLLTYAHIQKELAFTFDCALLYRAIVAVSVFSTL